MKSKQRWLRQISLLHKNSRITLVDKTFFYNHEH